MLCILMVSPTPSFLFCLSPPSLLCNFRITRQKKTPQNLNLSKQAEDPWAPIGRCSSHPGPQGIPQGVGGLAAVWEGGRGGGWGPDILRSALLSYRPACGYVSNTARTCKSERLPLYVCVQTGYCQVQVVGPTEQSGKLYT